ncbi:hypothetical protein V1264_024444 [Littorina saxatilis]|uniref:Sulfatase N-terminal domain-containing protein n=2 Tax=Littorina saxatilis TaxID=31220 RepID=A0AAN9ALP4_9CAEN
MSGYFPFHIGLQHLVIRGQQRVGLPTNLTTLPEQLKKVGYATHAIGKWHLGFCSVKYTPTYRGFDTFLGYLNGVEDYYTHYMDNGLDFRKNETVDREDSGIYSAYLYANRAMDIVRAHDKSKPLFLYLPFQSVHEPLQVPPQYEDRYCSQTSNHDRKTKCGMVAIMDEAIGNITQVLEAEGYMDNSLLIFTTDNGGPVWHAGINWPLRGAKATLWEGGTRGAGFLYSKKYLGHRAGQVHEGMMHAVDWFPTIMSLVGGKIPDGMDGVSQWESLVNGSPSPRTEFVYNMDDIPQFSAAIRSGDWKLIQGVPGSYNGWYPVPGVAARTEGDGFQTVDENVPGPNDLQLYNVKEDPTERNDVKNKFPDVLAKMKARLDQWRQTMVPANFPPDDPASNPDLFNGVWGPGWC